jgi:hypothetical protein
VRGCLYASSGAAESAGDDAEWILGAGNWYPSLSHVPPSVARLLGLSTGYVSDAGFAALGASLTPELAVADSAVVRIDGPLIWHAHAPWRSGRPVASGDLSAASASGTPFHLHSIGDEAMDRLTSRAVELLSLTSNRPAGSGRVSVHGCVGGSGQLRGITLRNVRSALPYCLIVTGPGPLTVLTTSEAAALSAPPVGPDSTGVREITSGDPVANSGVAANFPTCLSPADGVATTSNQVSLQLSMPLQIVQCDLGNRGGAGACVVAGNGAALLLLACRVSSGSGSGVLVQVRVEFCSLRLTHSRFCCFPCSVHS